MFIIRYIKSQTERETETDRETERDRKRETEKQRETENQRETQKQRETEKQRESTERESERYKAGLSQLIIANNHFKLIGINLIGKS